MRRVALLRSRLRSMPLRWHLAILIAGTLIPLVGFSAGMILRLAQQERTAIERRLQTAAENMADVLDARLRDTVQSLEALARSTRFEEPGLADLQDEARRVLPTQSGWLAIIVHDMDGKLLVHTGYPLDAPPPETVEPASLQQAIVLGKPVVGELAFGRNDWAFPVRVTVTGKQGKPRYILTAVLGAEALAPLVVMTAHDEEWTRVIVDHVGKVVARTRDPEKWVGVTGTPPFLAATSESTRGMYADITLDGQPVLVAFDHNPLSNWITAVTAPRSYVQAPVQRSLMMVVGLGLATLLLSLISATMFSRRVSHGIERAAAAAVAMAEGRIPDVPRSGITEIAGLSQAIRRTSRLLRRRQRERDEHLARAETARRQLHELNETLEQRVARRTAEAEQRAVQLRALASQLATAEDRERRRVAQTLHDDLQQVLVAAKMRISTARGRADDGMLKALADLEKLLDDSIHISRTLTSELSPLVLYDLGLPAALEWLGRQMRELHGLKVKVTADPNADLADDGLRAFLLNAARELLFNVVKHAGVDRARLNLSLDEQGSIVLAVSDHGAGIEAAESSRDPGASRRPASGLGLFGIRERLLYLGGRMDIRSTPEGETCVTLVLPRPGKPGADAPR